jgi:hypothetical protein
MSITVKKCRYVHEMNSCHYEFHAKNFGNQCFEVPTADISTVIVVHTLHTLSSFYSYKHTTTLQRSSSSSQNVFFL